MQQFEFHAYAADDHGVILNERAEITTYRGSEASAKGKAGRLAKNIKGPVDIALAGGAEWDERYITTASPSEVHTTGYRFERLT